jgi:ATP-dependent DNA ligase
VHPCLQLVQQSADHAEAEEWLNLLPIEGVVAKRADGCYLPGRRNEWVKVKRQRTADCVVIGITAGVRGPALVLGLKHTDGELHHFGVTQPVSDSVMISLTPVLNRAGAEESAIRSRWQHDAVPPWRRLPAEAVCEVSYTTLDAGRWLRQPGKFLRWRPDRSPEDCDLEQLAAPRL